LQLTPNVRTSSTAYVDCQGVCVFERQAIKNYYMGVELVEVKVSLGCWQESFVKGSLRKEQ
jgi:hypothetical protein